VWKEVVVATAAKRPECCSCCWLVFTTVHRVIKATVMLVKKHLRIKMHNVHQVQRPAASIFGIADAFTGFWHLKHK